MFTVDDLKTGYRVVLNNGQKGIYILEDEEYLYIYGENQRLTGNIRLYDEEYDDGSSYSEYMIKKVYKPARSSYYWELKDEDLLWKYDDMMHNVTIKEIEEKLGYRIRIVG